MPTRIRTALDQIVTVVESITTDTRFNNTTKFRHVDGAYSSEDFETARGRTRLFMLSLTGNSTISGPIGGVTEPSDTTEVIDLTVVYSMGRNAFELHKVIAEDHIRLRYNLMLPSNWSDGVMRQAVEGYSIDMADDDEGGAAILNIPIVFRYRPTF